MTRDEMIGYCNDFCDDRDSCANCPEALQKACRTSSIQDDPKMFYDIMKDLITPANDAVEHPSHYAGNGGIECIDAIRASMSTEEFCGYCKGNVLKYAWRYVDKNGVEDLEKAKVYLNWLIEAREKEAHPPEPNKKE